MAAWCSGVALRLRGLCIPWPSAALVARSHLLWSIISLNSETENVFSKRVERDLHSGEQFNCRTTAGECCELLTWISESTVPAMLSVWLWLCVHSHICLFAGHACVFQRCSHRLGESGFPVKSGSVVKLLQVEEWRGQTHSCSPGNTEWKSKWQKSEKVMWQILSHYFLAQVTV